MMLTFLELTHMVDATQHDGCQNTTRLSERTSKFFEDL